LRAARPWERDGFCSADFSHTTPKSKIEIPSLVIAGADDGALDNSRFETARPAFTGPYFYIELDGVGHFPQLEAPDAVADHILSFLKD